MGKNKPQQKVSHAAHTFFRLGLKISQGHTQQIPLLLCVIESVRDNKKKEKENKAALIASANLLLRRYTPLSTPDGVGGSVSSRLFPTHDKINAEGFPKDLPIIKRRDVLSSFFYTK